MSAPIYYIKNGFLRFGEKTLLADTEIYINREDRICLVGRNGSGKSSLMKVINSQYQLDDGTCYIEPGIKIGYLQQDIKNITDGSIMDFVMSNIPSEEQYKVDMILHELQIDGTLQMTNLSGGQFRRACLAKALIEEPDILLLDEPTNHLDIELIEWLEAYIKSYPGAVVCISHDRAFLNNVTNKIWWLDRTTLRKSDKGFKYFEEWQDVVLQIEESALTKLSKKMDSENIWLSRGVTARRKRNQRRLSHLKRLREELRAKRSMMNAATRKINTLEIGNSKKTTFIIEMDQVSFGYENTGPKNNNIITNFSIKVEKGEKIGIIGPNGSGKSTLIKLMVGELKQTSGKIRLGTNLEISYFDQSRSILNPKHTIKQTLCPNNGDYVELPDNKSMHVISYLKQFMFDPKEIDAKVSTLSGGEANRLLLAKTLTNPGNLLIMDEPTNDLDMDSLEILLEMLSEYNGTAIIVSHDRDFLEKLVTHTLVFNKDGTIDDIIGGYDDWAKNKKASPPSKTSKNTPKKEPSQSNKISTKTTYKDQYLIDTLPANIEKLELRNSEIQTTLSDNNLYETNPELFIQLSKELSDNQQEIEKKTNLWLSLLS